MRDEGEPRREGCLWEGSISISFSQIERGDSVGVEEGLEGLSESLSRLPARRVKERQPGSLLLGRGGMGALAQDRLAAENLPAGCLALDPRFFLDLADHLDDALSVGLLREALPAKKASQFEGLGRIRLGGIELPAGGAEGPRGTRYLPKAAIRPSIRPPILRLARTL